MTQRTLLNLARMGILTKPTKVGIPLKGVHCVFDEKVLKIELEVVNIYKCLGYTYKQIQEFKQNGEFDILKEVVENAG